MPCMFSVCSQLTTYMHQILLYKVAVVYTDCVAVGLQTFQVNALCGFVKKTFA